LGVGFGVGFGVGAAVGGGVGLVAGADEGAADASTDAAGTDAASDGALLTVATAEAVGSAVELTPLDGVAAEQAADAKTIAARASGSNRDGRVGRTSRIPLGVTGRFAEEWDAAVLRPCRQSAWSSGPPPAEVEALASPRDLAPEARSAGN